jgi:hypothetical protein
MEPSHSLAFHFLECFFSSPLYLLPIDVAPSQGRTLHLILPTTLLLLKSTHLPATHLPAVLLFSYSNIFILSPKSDSLRYKIDLGLINKLHMFKEYKVFLGIGDRTQGLARSKQPL